MKLPFWATTLTILSTIILCTLGTWQIQRLVWKQDIINRLQTAQNDYNEKTAFDFSLMNKDDFAYGRIEGTFLADKAFLLGPRIRNKEVGNDLIVPLESDQGTILVDMGWTKIPLKEQPIYSLQGKTVWFNGLARAPKWNSFTPENEPQNDIWYKPDIIQIAKLKGLQNPIPFMLYPKNSSDKFDATYPNNEDWQPNNNHLQYAIFWFALAGALIIVYIFRFIKKQP